MSFAACLSACIDALHPNHRYIIPLLHLAKAYTLLLVRRDGQSLSFRRTVFIHWIKINVPGDNLNGGNEILTYMGMKKQCSLLSSMSPTNFFAAPSTSGDQYYILLYKQSGQISSVDSALGTNCPAGQEFRCKFLLQSFVNGNGLMLEALNRFRTKI